MAESPQSGEEIIFLDEESRVNSPDDENQLAAVPSSGESSRNGSQQSQLVDMTVTEDNPIFLTGICQDSEIVSIQGDPNVTEMMSQLQSNVQSAIVPRNQSQQLMLHSGEKHSTTQLVPGNEIIPLNQETQIALPPDEEERRIALQGTSVELNQGAFFQPNFGPQSNTKHIEANQIEHAMITHHHHQVHHHSHYYKKHGISSREEPSTSVVSQAKRRKKETPGEKSDADEGLTHLSESFWINEKRPLAREGKVFEGLQTSEVLDDEKIAIKVIRACSERNQREARNLRRLRPHTNVVTILHSDTFTEAKFKSMYIAMELCSTVNLEHYIEDRKTKKVPFNLKQSLEHARQIVNAIDHIHDHNILHRDLKPTSVLFSLCGKYLKICDFGLSKKLRNGCSVTGLSRLKVGTDGYRAPETYNKDIISKMADIFSLGLVLCFLWSYGIHPFGLDPEIWSYNIKNFKNFDLSHLRTPLSEFAKNLLARMLKLEPKQRLKIDKVKNDLMKLDWFASLTKNLVQIWNGDIKDHAGADVLPVCELYRSPELQDVIDISGSDWLFQMNTIPFVDIGSLKNLTGEKPSGYLVTSAQDELKKLTERLAKNKLMAWIDITKEGHQRKVLALLYHKDYPELFGFFLPDPQILTSLVQGFVSTGTSSPQQPSSVDARSVVDSSESNLIDQNVPSRSKPTKSAVIKDTIESFPEAFQVKRAEPPAALRATSSTSKYPTTETKQVSPELIPWWIFTGPK